MKGALIGKPWLVVLLIALVSACATDGANEEAAASPAAQELAAGIKSYEAGKDADALRHLQSSLKGELSGAEQVTAHKHLAFIHCAANRIAPCRDSFRQALKIEPKFELTPAEIGHPVWGPVYRAVKSGR